MQSYALNHRLPAYAPIDIDILIRINKIDKLIKLLRNKGFRLSKTIYNYSEIDLYHNPQLTFVNTSNSKLPRAIDVHLLIFNPTKSIFNSMPVNKGLKITRQMFLRKRKIKFGPTNFFILENEDMLLHQCLNFFFHHCCRGKRQLHDIADIIKILPIKWPVILERLIEWDLETYAHYSLQLAKEIYHAPIPKKILDITAATGPLRNYISNFINKTTIDQPINNPRLRYRFNIWLRFLLSKEPIWRNLAKLLSPIVLLRIIKDLRYVPCLLRSIIPTNSKSHV